MTGINHRLSWDPSPGEGGSRQQAACLFQPVGLSLSAATARLPSHSWAPSASRSPLRMEGGLERVPQSLGGWGGGGERRGGHKVQQRLSSGGGPKGPAEAPSYSHNPKPPALSLPPQGSRASLG